MDNIFGVFYRTIFVLALLFLIAKMIGKKQISQLNLFDYIIGITIGSIAADISLDLEKNLISGILAIFLYGLASYIISIVTLRSISLRRIFNGVPTVLVEKGKIIQSGFDKSKIDINEFLSQARINGYFDLNEIDYAIMEINGSISFLPNEKDKPVNKKDMKRRREKDQEVNKSISDYDNNNKETGWIDGIHADENALKEVPASVEDGIIQYFKEMDSRQRELIQKAIENSMPDLYIRRMFVLDYEKMKQFYDSYFS